MEDLLMWWQSLDPFWYWGLSLIFIFPLILLLVNELGYSLNRKDEELARPVKTITNYVLPLTGLVVLLIKVLDFDGDAISIRVLETIIWVLVINTSLALGNRFFFESADKSTWRGKVPQLFLDIFRVLLVLTGGAIVLSYVWNVELGGLATALGLGSFVLGLALQDTLGNLFSGIALVYEKPFTEGDWIKVDDEFGRVTEMNWRAVRIVTREGKMIVFPHLMIGQGMIINFSQPTKVHIIKLEIGFSHSDPPNKVKEALLETCLSTPHILHEPAPEVKTQEYAESAIKYEVEFGIADFAFHEEITDEFMTRVWYTAKRHHLLIPFPQLTLHRAEKRGKPEDELDRQLDTGLERLPSYLPIEATNVDDLKDGSAVLHYGKDEVVFSQGDATGNLYVILDGEVTLSTKGQNGKSVVVNKLHPGDFFGEVAILSSRTSSMTAEATTDIRIILIKTDEVMDMVSKNPKLAFQLDEVMDLRRNSIHKNLSKN
jgi:small-conductance mechanosensitive channel